MNVLIVLLLFGLAVWVAFDIRRPFTLRAIGTLIFSVAGWAYLGTHFG